MKKKLIKWMKKKNRLAKKKHKFYRLRGGKEDQRGNGRADDNGSGRLNEENW